MTAKWLLNKIKIDNNKIIDEHRQLKGFVIRVDVDVDCRIVFSVRASIVLVIFVRLCVYVCL